MAEFGVIASSPATYAQIMGVFIYRSNNGTSEGSRQAAVVEVSSGKWKGSCNQAGYGLSTSSQQRLDLAFGDGAFKLNSKDLEHVD